MPPQADPAPAAPAERAVRQPPEGRMLARRMSGSAVTRGQFALLFAAMLVAASGNTAVQSVMPAIGRQLAMPDVVVAVAYTVSAVLWVALAPYWARMSDVHGRKALTLMGVGAFGLSTLLCGLALAAGLAGWIGAGAAFLCFALARAIYGAFGSATPSATQAYLAARTRRSGRVAALSALASSFGLGTVVGPALAPLFVIAPLGVTGPFLAFAVIALTVGVAVAVWLPDERRAGRAGRAAGRGAAMSYPSLASPTTGASVIAATAPRRAGAGEGAALRWRDARVRRWIIAGVTAGHAQAALLTLIGFLVIDRLHLAAAGSEQSISIVLMAGAAATLAAQWGMIPRLGWSPRALVSIGAAVAAAGVGLLMLAHDLHALVLGFALASLGFGFGRPGFTGGASLAVPLAEQGAVAGIVTSANGVSYVAAPTGAMLLYAIHPLVPLAVAAALLAGLAGWAWRRLPESRVA